MGSGINALSLATGLVAVSGLGASAGSLCTDDAVWLRGDFGKVRFSVDIADDEAERAQGLMFVETMPTSRGMLFVYDREAPNGVAFWMKNTLIPLDMIFADRTGAVIKVHENAIPGDLTAIPSDGPAQYVLEINGGLAAQLGIEAGAQMRHPTIEEAVWPCE
ncbi:DUF192 domain-containing protein [Pacificoceanicola onchidii]|uniref:DUF192 domain-containing protein n=1 Tax=Pacificoceanicola onchidii TaxID=2562685 RepID=UPI0010A63347|nr:DUF192 domain-containing protein [Pacificoceanicola onchidii]